VCEHELQGVVAKRRLGRYLPGDRGWIKTKNRDYWRYEMERQGVLKRRRAAVRVAAGTPIRLRASASPCSSSKTYSSTEAVADAEGLRRRRLQPR
jgi:hypothetical protein